MQCCDAEQGDDLFVEAIAAVRGGTDTIAIATATAVAKLRIKQFWAIPLAGKVVAGPCMLAMPLFLLYRVLGPRSRTGGADRRLVRLLTSG